VKSYERECANPRCSATLSELVPLSILYCGNCQLQFRKLSLLFPAANEDDLRQFFHQGQATLKQTARLLGMNRRTVMIFRQRGYLNFVQQGKYALISISDLLRFVLWKRELVLMSKVARILRISYEILKKMARQKLIRPTFQYGRLKYFHQRSLTTILRRYHQWLGLAGKRQRKIASAQIRVGRNRLSMKEIANRLGVSNSAVWARVIDGTIIAKRNGRFWSSSQEEFIASCQVIVGKKQAKSHLRKNAQKYLDSLAPN